jgi:hypothetical protein
LPRVEFVNQSASNDASIASNPARLLNLYPSPVADGANARTTFLLKSVLGQEALSNIGDFPIRASGRGNGKNWIVGDGKLWEVSSIGGLTNRGTVADDANTTIDGNQSLVTIVSGNKYYTWNGTIIAEPTTKTFSNVGSHCYIGGFTVITEKNGKRFQWSTIGDAGTLNALDFASADRVDDNILRAAEFRGNLLLFGDRSTEIWTLDPDASTNPQRFVYTDVTNTGLKSFNLLTRFDDALFFVGNDNRAYIFGQGVVSNTSVETAIAKSTPTHCFYYEDEGQKFCVIRFSDRPAWVYDITTGLWHERSEGAGHVRWRATCSLREGANWAVGNADGDLLFLTRSNEDLNGPLYRRMISRPITLGDRKFTIAEVEFLARVGEHSLTGATTFALSVGDGFVLLLEAGSPDDFALLLDTEPAEARDAEIGFYISRDGGFTWIGPKVRSMGRLGDYQQRMTWHSQGQAQQVAFRFDIAEPADISLYSDGYVTAI